MKILYFSFAVQIRETAYIIFSLHCEVKITGVMKKIQSKLNTKHYPKLLRLPHWLFLEILYGVHTVLSPLQTTLLVKRKYDSIKILTQYAIHTPLER